MNPDPSRDDDQKSQESSWRSLALSETKIAQQLEELQIMSATVRGESELARTISQKVRDEARRIRELAKSVRSGVADPRILDGS